MTRDQIKTISLNLSGKLCVNGRVVGPQIQMIFKTCTDTLTPFRKDAQERFLDLMTQAGKKTEAETILEFSNK